MERIYYNSYRFIAFIDKLNPRNSGIFFSIFLHLLMLSFVIGLPNIFGHRDIYVPNIIPIEILNVSDKTNIEKSSIDNQINKNNEIKQKKFNSSDNTEVQKQFEIEQNTNIIDNQNQLTIEVKEKQKVTIEEKKVEIKQKENINDTNKIETINTNQIKPKLKPKANIKQNSISESDIQIKPKSEKEISNEKKEVVTQPKPKPKEDFSIASMLKDLRNEETNDMSENNILDDNKEQVGEDKQNENMILSISEIDLLRQQLSSCWNAPAGAVINLGDRVTISAKIRQNMKVLENSVRIVDTNIAKSNPFYGPITDSAMRTLLNPECTPLKLPKDKYNLWKNLTITFDYSIMKGY